MLEEQNLGSHQLLLKSSIITAPTGSAHSCSTNFNFRNGAYGWPSGVIYADGVYIRSALQTFNNPAGTRDATGANTVWKDVDISQFIPRPFNKFDWYDLDVSLTNLELYGDAADNVNPIDGQIFELYLDSPGLTRSVIYHTGDAYKAPTVNRGTMMTHVFKDAAAAYFEQVTPGAGLQTDIKPVLRLRVPASQLTVDLHLRIEPVMGDAPLNPDAVDGILEFGPLFVLLDVSVTGVNKL